MKILIKTLRRRVERFYDLGSLPADWTLIWGEYEKDIGTLLAMAGDADAIFADAVEPIPRALIAGMPNLKIIHSEGVGFDKIDLPAATERGIYVCNNRAANSRSVAEHAIMLMLCLTRRLAEGDAMVRQARQIEAKSAWSLEGIPELFSLHAGLIGMGAIGRETAKLLRAFGTRVSYYSRTRLSPEDEAALGVDYLPLPALLNTCDILSLHLSVTAETRHFINSETLAQIKPGALLINTARGDLIDQAALAAALMSGQLGGVGLDCLTPEPVTADNPLLTLPESLRYKLLFSPHIAGVTEQAFRKMHATVWHNFIAISRGDRPENIVNIL